MADVFISYKRDDRPRIEALATALDSLGLSVFFDARIPTGSVFDEVVNEELKIARSVIVCWTPGAVESRWVRAEASIGLERDILLAAFFDSAKLPPPFNLVHAEDLRTWNGDLSDVAFGRLLVRLGQIVARTNLAEEARGLAVASKWQLQDVTARAEFDTKMGEARRIFAVQQQTAPIEFESRMQRASSDFESWLSARRLGKPTPPPDPLLAVETNVERLRSEIDALRGEKNAMAAIIVRQKEAARPVRPSPVPRTAPPAQNAVPTARPNTASVAPKGQMVRWVMLLVGLGAAVGLLLVVASSQNLYY